MGKRAENKVKLNIYIDKDLRERFKTISNKNNTDMTAILVETIQNYIKENEISLETK